MNFCVLSSLMHMHIILSFSRSHTRRAIEFFQIHRRHNDTGGHIVGMVGTIVCVDGHIGVSTELGATLFEHEFGERNPKVSFVSSLFMHFVIIIYVLVVVVVVVVVLVSVRCMRCGPDSELTNNNTKNKTFKFNRIPFDTFDFFIFFLFFFVLFLFAQNTFSKHSIHRDPILVGMGVWHGHLFDIPPLRSNGSRLYGEIRFDFAIFCQRQTQLHTGIHGTVFGDAVQRCIVVSRNS